MNDKTGPTRAEPVACLTGQLSDALHVRHMRQYLVREVGININL